MCGLVAMMTLANNGFYATDLEVFQEMLYVDALRGADSTGVFCVDRKLSISGIKHASHPINTFMSPAWANLKGDAIRSGKILVGHNRKATHGTVNNANAHPFYEKHIILVHNGTLWDHKNKLGDRDVDSHAFAAKLAETAPEDVPQLLADVEGAYAFIWWDRNQKKLFICRNKDRPLNLLKYNNKLVFASEAWMARGPILRNEKNGNLLDDKNPNALRQFEVMADKLYSYDLNGNQEMVDLPAKKAKVTVTTTNSMVPAIVTASQQHHGKTNTTTNERVVPLWPNGGPVPHNRKDSPFVNGQLIVAKIDRVQDVSAGTSRRLRMLGKVAQIGKPTWDVNGLLPDTVDIGDVQDWIGKYVMGIVMSVNAHLPAGPSLMLRGVDRAGKQISSWNGKKLFQPEWNWVQHNCRCKHCDAKALPYDWQFTNLKFDQLQNVEMICADCVEDRIENEEIKNKFCSDRIAALDCWQPISEESAIGTKQPNRVEGPSTLQ